MNHLADYKVISSEEAADFLVGDWDVNEWAYDAPTKYSFHSDGTYTRTEAGKASNPSAEWAIIDGLTYLEKRADGSWNHILEIRDFKDDGYLFIRYNTHNNQYSFFTATPENRPARSLPYRDKNFDYYEQLWSMPTADSAVNGIHFVKMEDSYQSGVTTYVYYYQLSSEKEQAKAAYAEYQQILSEYFDTETGENDSFLVSINGQLKSVLMAGKDNQLGYYLVLSLNTKE